MKLLTHNMLTSKCLKGVTVGYPLAIVVRKLSEESQTLEVAHHKFEAKDIKVSEVDFNSEFIVRIIPKLDWATLWKAAESDFYKTTIFEVSVYEFVLKIENFKKIGHVGELPETLVEDFEANEDFLKKVHHVLLEVEVINGDLLCPESGRKFPINDGIPNMLLNEDEV